jgi:HTH-type transcriptional repressor of NAD biosynthesis genes
MSVRGFVLGKFMPPHVGHLYLCEVAQAMCDELTVVVGSLAHEPIDGALRASWVRELMPRARVVHLAAELPRDPSELPRFKKQWFERLRASLPALPDRVFSSDHYGRRLAEELGASWIPVDPARSVFPISGTAIRGAPMRHFASLPRCVRPHFVRRVSVIGPKATGKSTLAAELARAAGTICAPEFARTYLEARGGELAPSDVDVIGRGQIAIEDALARDAARALICDTDPLFTVAWSEATFGDAPGWLREAARGRAYDLTILCDVDLPWAGDAAHGSPEGRRALFARCEHALREAGRPYQIARGTGAARGEAAHAAVLGLLAAEA